MSLDVYLLGNTKEVSCECLRCGHKHTTMEEEQLFAANITHNLAQMADAAGLYECVWRPEEQNITQAKELIEPLTKGIIELKANPEKYKKLDPENKWGTYLDFIPWLQDYLNACIAYPEAKLKVSR
jgi:bifunctional ADP-heptose synthase (sugar kinase/adenylyltransferase)